MCTTLSCALKATSKCFCWGGFQITCADLPFESEKRAIAMRTSLVQFTCPIQTFPHIQIHIHTCPQTHQILAALTVLSLSTNHCSHSSKHIINKPPSSQPITGRQTTRHLREMKHHSLFYSVKHDVWSDLAN